MMNNTYKKNGNIESIHDVLYDPRTQHWDWVADFDRVRLGASCNNIQGETFQTVIKLHSSRNERSDHAMKGLIFGIFFLLSGCAGIMGGNTACSLRETNTEVAELLQKSCGGDQYASFQLGEIYAQRAAVADSEQDWSHALNFYQIAAQPNAGHTFIYIPGAGKVSGYTMPVQTGAATAGLAEAQFRLGQMYLDGNGVKSDAKTALRYFKMSAAQGHEEAMLFLP